MTTERSIIDVMADFFAEQGMPVRRELHVAEPVWRFLRQTYAKAIPPEAATVMTGLPIIDSHTLTGGQWQIIENGEVASAGDMAPAPEGMTVSYSPTTGWIAIRTDLTDPEVTRPAA